MELESERRTERREAEGAEKKRLKPDKSEARSEKRYYKRTSRNVVTEAGTLETGGRREVKCTSCSSSRDDFFRMKENR